MVKPRRAPARLSSRASEPAVLGSNSSHRSAWAAMRESYSDRWFSCCQARI